MTSSSIWWNCSSTTSMKFCAPRGTSSSWRVADEGDADEDDHRDPRVGHVVGNAREGCKIGGCSMTSMGARSSVAGGAQALRDEHGRQHEQAGDQRHRVGRSRWRDEGDAQSGEHGAAGASADNAEPAPAAVGGRRTRHAAREPAEAQRARRGAPAEHARRRAGRPASTAAATARGASADQRRPRSRASPDSVAIVLLVRAVQRLRARKKFTDPRRDAEAKPDQ